ncbi:hypothetical protein IE53DRAFT_145692 [Violaceomyces palustris]|uniref:Uncharacterized protein n=1 Tax=Violaceomyces palustris TaxID=1673888 RepID=A0ACD0P699_9BASI|nr:hypothetical protein IE53DRAFT_145692 [Violaceomyces palustris]
MYSHHSAPHFLFFHPSSLLSTYLVFFFLSSAFFYLWHMEVLGQPRRSPPTPPTPPLPLHPSFNAKQNNPICLVGTTHSPSTLPFPPTTALFALLLCCYYYYLLSCSLSISIIRRTLPAHVPPRAFGFPRFTWPDRVGSRR